MRTRSSLLLPSLAGSLLALWAALPAVADTVYLRNGRSFEGVVADVGETQVKVHLPGGVLSLPRSTVLRVEKAESNLGEYDRRKQALGRDARAEDWLELARWARAHGFEFGLREASQTAAALDPVLPGLAPLMRSQGYVLDEEMARWIPYADEMRRHGMVLDGGEWVTRREYEERAQARQDEAIQRRTALLEQQAALAERDARQAELMRATADLYQQATAGPYDSIPLGYGSLWAFPGFFSATRRFDRDRQRGPMQPMQMHDGHHQGGFTLRQPGGFLSGPAGSVFGTQRSNP